MLAYTFSMDHTVWSHLQLAEKIDIFAMSDASPGIVIGYRRDSADDITLVLCQPCTLTTRFCLTEMC